MHCSGIMLSRFTNIFWSHINVNKITSNKGLPSITTQNIDEICGIGLKRGVQALYPMVHPDGIIIFAVSYVLHFQVRDTCWMVHNVVTLFSLAYDLNMVANIPIACTRRIRIVYNFNDTLL